MQTIEEAKQAKESRDSVISELDKIIEKIEQYKKICDNANQMTYADKKYLITKAEELFFDEEVLTIDCTITRKDNPQMFTDIASIGRSLLEK